MWHLFYFRFCAFLIRLCKCQLHRFLDAGHPSQVIYQHGSWKAPYRMVHMCIATCMLASKLPCLMAKWLWNGETLKPSECALESDGTGFQCCCTTGPLPKLGGHILYILTTPTDGHLLEASPPLTQWRLAWQIWQTPQKDIRQHLSRQWCAILWPHQNAALKVGWRGFLMHLLLHHNPSNDSS